MAHFCVLSATELDQDLAVAELWALTGVEGSGRVVRIPEAVNVERAAYVTACAELLASGPSPESLSQQLEACRPEFERFRITLQTIPPRPRIGSQEAIVEAARHVYGSVDVNAPLTELLLVGSESEWHFGRVVSRASKTYLAHEHKPYQFSSALPARVARAMVNLAAAPGDAVLDPCCGVGTILLEAWAAGMSAVGGDLNPKLAGMTRANLSHFGRPPWVCIADAGVPWARADAVVTDFPYGRQSERKPRLYERLLAAFPSFAPRLALVTADDVSGLLAAAGYRVLRTVEVSKPQGFKRRIHVAQVS
jgi:tRNA G10  N-methylase Trm11